MRIFNFGSINIDHVYRVPHLVQPGETLASHSYQKLLGGKGANQSIALAKAGAQVTHLGRYHATDADILEPMHNTGVDISALQTTTEPSGHAIIQVDDAAENAIVLYPGANHSFQPSELPALLENAQPGDWLLLQNECSCTAEIIGTAVENGLQVAFNPAPMNDDVRDLPLEKLALLFVNKVEAQQLLGLTPDSTTAPETLAKQLQTRLPDTQVVLTLGAEGACWLYQGQQEFASAFPVSAVDTTGAGDTFIGYFMQAMTTGLTIASALELACKASALCVQRPGASASIPIMDEVQAFHV